GGGKPMVSAGQVSAEPHGRDSPEVWWARHPATPEELPREGGVRPQRRRLREGDPTRRDQPSSSRPARLVSAADAPWLPPDVLRGAAWSSTRRSTGATVAAPCGHRTTPRSSHRWRSDGPVSRCPMCGQKSYYYDRDFRSWRCTKCKYVERRTA